MRRKLILSIAALALAGFIPTALDILSFNGQEMEKTGFGLWMSTTRISENEQALKAFEAATKGAGLTLKFSGVLAGITARNNLLRLSITNGVAISLYFIVINLEADDDVNRLMGSGADISNIGSRMKSQLSSKRFADAFHSFMVHSNDYDKYIAYIRLHAFMLTGGLKRMVYPEDNTAFIHIALSPQDAKYQADSIFYNKVVKAYLPLSRKRIVWKSILHPTTWNKAMAVMSSALPFIFGIST